MGKLKPWQIGLFVAAVVVVGGAAVWSITRDRVTLVDSVQMVDVTTGELFRFPVTGQRAVVLPERNPKTGKIALLPARRGDDGVYRVDTRYFGDLREVEGDPVKLDRSTGVVQISAEP